MNPLRIASHLLLRALLWLLVGYWVILIIYTVKNWMEGGPRLVMGWYADIEGTIFNFSLKLFVLRQLLILGFTIGLFLLDRLVGRRAESKQLKPNERS